MHIHQARKDERVRVVLNDRVLHAPDGGRLTNGNQLPALDQQYRRGRGHSGRIDHP
jgi:hypothetical protein